MLKASRTYASSFRIDGPTQDRLAWITEAIAHMMPGTRVSHSTIMRRALACYLAQLEHVIGSGSNSYTKPRLIQAEGHELQHYRQEHRTDYWSKLPVEALYIDGVFQPYTKLVKTAIKSAPSALDRLVNDSFSRRAD